METSFDFTDEERWPTPTLQERMQELIKHGNSVPLGAERMAAMSRLILHMYFELEERDKDGTATPES